MKNIEYMRKKNFFKNPYEDQNQYSSYNKFFMK